MEKKKNFVDYKNLKEYDEQLKKYIDKKIEEAIAAYEQSKSNN